MSRDLETAKCHRGNQHHSCIEFDFSGSGVTRIAPLLHRILIFGLGGDNFKESGHSEVPSWKIASLLHRI